MGFEQWRNYDLTMIDASRAVWVLNLNGWVTSNGVTYELNYAYRQKHPTFFVDYETLEVTKLNVPNVLNGRLWGATDLDRCDNAIKKD